MVLTSAVILIGLLLLAAPLRKNNFYMLHLVFINFVTFVAYGVDKHAARKGNWRVPESNLHTLEFLGGWAGALLGQKIFHHKSKKRSYQTFFWLMMIFEAGMIFVILKFLKII